MCGYINSKKPTSPCPNVVIFRSILVLKKRGTQFHHHLHHMIFPRWNLTIVSYFNTPPQLGRIPPIKIFPLINMSSSHHMYYLYSTLTLEKLSNLKNNNHWGEKTTTLCPLGYYLESLSMDYYS